LFLRGILQNIYKKHQKWGKLPEAENGRKFCTKVVGVSKNGQK